MQGQCEGVRWEQLRASPLVPRLGGDQEETERQGENGAEGPLRSQCLGKECIAGREEGQVREAEVGGERFPRRTVLGDDMTI